MCEQYLVALKSQVNILITKGAAMIKSGLQQPGVNFSLKK